MPHEIDRDQVRRLIAEEGAQLVEVLPAKEFGEEHIVGAVNIPLERFSADLLRGRPARRSSERWKAFSSFHRAINCFSRSGKLTF